MKKKKKKDMKLIDIKTGQVIIEVPNEAIEDIYKFISRENPESNEEIEWSIELKQEWVESLSIRDFISFFDQFKKLESDCILSLDYVVESHYCSELPEDLSINTHTGFTIEEYDRKFIIEEYDD